MTNKNRFVKYDNKYFEVIIDEKGFKLVPIDAKVYVNAVADRTVLEDTSIEIGKENIFQTIIDETRDELVDKLKDGIKDTVLRSLGFEKDKWSNGKGYSIDHCNGRMSEVTQLIGNDLRDAIFSATYKDIGLTEEEIIDLNSCMRKEFVHNYKRAMNDQIRHKATCLAGEHVQEMVDDLIKTKGQVIAEKTLDVLLTQEKK